MGFYTTADTAFGHCLDAMGRTVTYARGGASVSLTALPEEVVIEGEDHEGLIVPVAATRFQFRASDLVLSGAATEPRHGDVITYGGASYDVRADYEHANAGTDAATYRVTTTRRGA
jgi:hypothetical protein